MVTIPSTSGGFGLILDLEVGYHDPSFFMIFLSWQMLRYKWFTDMSMIRRSFLSLLLRMETGEATLIFSLQPMDNVRTQKNESCMLHSKYDAAIENIPHKKHSAYYTYHLL
jgi:hypothetical protein